MNVLFVDVDNTNYPNLALMKLSAHHKKIGDVTFLNSCTNPDIVYVSVVFDWNRKKALQTIKRYKMWGYEVVTGGYPLTNQTLPKDIEHIMPDYELYGLDYSMGFTSRGCIRNCEFCIVREKEGVITHNASIYEFLKPAHKHLVLMDNNLLASPKVEQTLIECSQSGVTVDFNQGLDIRLVTPKLAALLSGVKVKPNYRFAFDDIKLTSSIESSVGMLTEVGIKPRDIMFYMLIGFDTTPEQDMERMRTLKRLGAVAFPMIYKPPHGRKGARPVHKIDKQDFLDSYCKMPFFSYIKLARYYGVYEKNGHGKIKHDVNRLIDEPVEAF